MTTTHAHPDLMPCMEVWGGNAATDRGVVMLGLDAWVHSRPHQDAEGGGDVYYVSSCATGRVTRLLVSDVSGHGAGVAETGVALRKLMRRYVNHIDQTRFVSELNREFTALSSQGGFATAVAATFFAPTNELAIANAGHPPPLLFRRKTRDWSVLRHESASTKGLSNVPLGVTDITSYDQHELKLAVGDIVLLYTDSLIESREANGRHLGVAGFHEIAASLNPDDPQVFLGELQERIASLHEGNLTTDDVTIMLFRCNGLSPSVPIMKRVLAPVLLIASMVRAVFPGAKPIPWPEWSLANIGGGVIPPVSRWRKKRNSNDGAAVANSRAA